MPRLPAAILSWAVLLPIAAALPAAAALPVEISVQRAPAAEECPGPAELRAAVDRIVQSPAGNGPAIVARVEFRRAEAGFEAQVLLEGPKPGERRLTDTGSSCAPLAQAVAVTLALLLDDAPAAPAASPAPLEPGGALWLSAGPGLGVSAETTLSVGGAVALSWPRWSVHAGGVYLVPRDAELAPGRVTVGLSWGELLLCRALHGGASFRLDVCADGAAGWLSGHGQGYPSSTDAGFVWLAAGAAVRLGGTLGSRWLWGAAARALLPLGRHSFSVENAGTAYRSDRVAGVVDLELGVRLW